MTQNTQNEGVPVQGGIEADNPYQQAARAPEPNLDANAPYLRSADVQRLNRKALWFLAGIIALTLAAFAWILSGGLSKGEEEAPKKKGEELVIPAAPKDLPELPLENGVTATESEMPPLPVIEEAPPMPQPMMPMSDSMPNSSMVERPMTLRERRMLDVANGSADGSAAMGTDPNGGAFPPTNMQGQGAQQPPDGVTSAKPLYNPNTLLLRGTYIRCVLETRVITDVPGYTSCVVTEPVYSVNGRRLLLPRGSKVSGAYSSDAIVGKRAAIVWDRITTPTGLDVNMRSPGVDNLGSAGNTGHYSAHWGHRISSALLISMISDAFKYAGAKHGPESATVTDGAVVMSPYESNTARTMERLANAVLDKNMQRPPTVVINQGTVVNVYVARDVDFSTVMQ